MNLLKKQFKEIGSSFSFVETCDKVNTLHRKTNRYAFSGRTSLIQIIDAILKGRVVKKAWLPSYCCESMVIPFLSRGIEVEYYNVLLKNRKPEFDGSLIETPDIIYTMNYFGVDLQRTLDFEKYLRKKFPDAVIIRDITHSMLAAGQCFDSCDYAFASIRKWSGFSDGGVIVKCKDDIEYSIEQYNCSYGELIDVAKAKKTEYLRTGRGDKREFLDMFARAEELLDEDFEGYSISSRSKNEFEYFDIEKVAFKRKKNFLILMENSEIFQRKGIYPIFDKIDDKEVPLAFPVLLDSSEERDRFRRYLIENEVFCPVHWPKNEVHRLNNATEEIYDKELSIVCDQRYGATDMKRLLKLVEEY